MVDLSASYEPAMIKGVTVHPDNPFLFDFIVDPGQDRLQKEALKQEGEKLIKYFLANLAIPEKDMWVNLSPYEKQRMVPMALGQTEMGRDLLAEDYMLKQITASLIYPEKGLGKSFWERVYAQAREKYGSVAVPVNTFNKVWIMADKAEIYQHHQTALVVNCHLKVMLEEDYLSMRKHGGQAGDILEKGTVPWETMIKGQSPFRGRSHASHPTPNEIVRQIILPQLEHEVNNGKNFANLRQIFNSIILSSWYKNNLKEALLNQVFADKGKVKGIDLKDPGIQDKIYERYIQAYKKGVFNFIKEDAVSRLPRKYFSGGIDAAMAAHPALVGFNPGQGNGRPVEVLTAGVVIRSRAGSASANAAMIVGKPHREIFERLNSIFDRYGILHISPLGDIYEEYLKALRKADAREAEEFSAYVEGEISLQITALKLGIAGHFPGQKEISRSNLLDYLKTIGADEYLDQTGHKGLALTEAVYDLIANSTGEALINPEDDPLIQDAVRRANMEALNEQVALFVLREEPNDFKGFEKPRRPVDAAMTEEEQAQKLQAVINSDRGDPVQLMEDIHAVIALRRTMGWDESRIFAFYSAVGPRRVLLYQIALLGFTQESFEPISKIGPWIQGLNQQWFMTVMPDFLSGVSRIEKSGFSDEQKVYALSMALAVILNNTSRLIYPQRFVYGSRAIVNLYRKMGREDSRLIQAFAGRNDIRSLFYLGAIGSMDAARALQIRLKSGGVETRNRVRSLFRLTNKGRTDPIFKDNIPLWLAIFLIMREDDSRLELAQWVDDIKALGSYQWYEGVNAREVEEGNDWGRTRPRRRGSDSTGLGWVVGVGILGDFAQMHDPKNAADPGGIDLATSGVQWKIHGDKIEMNMDKAMLERIRREGIDGVELRILRMRSVPSAQALWEG